MYRVETFVVGGAQRSFREVPSVGHPAELMALAGRAAFADAGIADPAAVDVIACVEPLSWTYDDLAGVVARELGLRDSVEKLWTPAGGTSPQDLLHSIGLRIAAGEVECALICGAEAVRTRLQASKSSTALDWPTRPAGVSPVRGQKPFSSELELRHGLGQPIHLFPLIENALRSAHGRTAVEQIRVAAGLLAANARVAATNPHAWFRDAPSAEEIAAVSPRNRMVVYPYAKRMNAILEVDQCAAIVVASKGFAEQHGMIPRSMAVLGGAGAEEVWNPIERASLGRCPAMSRAITLALERGGLSADEVDAMDLYSCFPSAIQLALPALGTTVEDGRPLSLTGGLAFAGGPGNAYVLHSLATALERVRADGMIRILVTGIGMANTKHTATVLSGARGIPEAASGTVSLREPTGERPVPVVAQPTGAARVSTWTVEYGRDGQPVNVLLVLDLEDGRRSIANMRDCKAGAEQLLWRDPVGRRGRVEHDPAANRNFFSLDRED
jgi:acetyl-CoA C-acetyltransferase